ncbi:magnesium transporter [Dethiosulfovibrio salsuginis]|uniref:Magnesium transporter MgtE n=2 Tax=Dethiosulfovibrio salsuginis TaxID=561720 RepID=A0A1X7JZV8_9BACT|nr:magnesium transporter [Dethiosulfovibrio salsuginis]
MKKEMDKVIVEVLGLLASEDSKGFARFFDKKHPAQVAEVLSEVSPMEAWSVLRYATRDLRAEIFSHLDLNFQIEIVISLGRDEVARLFSDLPPDDRTDLYKRLPEEVQDSILPAMAQGEREDIRRLSSYKEGTAGSVMTSDYATLTVDLTAAQAIEKLREIAPDRETIYYSYVVDESRRLLGYVSLRDLILAHRDSKVENLMHRNFVFARVNDDQEDAASKIQKYDLIALPVINGGDALVGIITHDDALDVISQEQTEDMEKLMAIGGSHEMVAYMKISPWQHFKNRVGWLIGLAILGLVSGAIVQGYETLLLQFAVLATFMPMLADTGGNTGSQSATLVVRALATKEISSEDLLRVLWREFLVALPLGAVLAVLAFARVYLFAPEMPEGSSLIVLGLAVGLALGAQVVTSTLFGALLPMGAAKLKLDPALVASPALTTVVDITGLLIYFTIAKSLLGL